MRALLTTRQFLLACLRATLTLPSAAHTPFSPHVSSSASFTASCSTSRLFASGSHRCAHTRPHLALLSVLPSLPAHDAPVPARI
ncbi:hypothetical protein B0H14DRAFT_3070845 [Mycena olivaceomarginata]|nr:hypothetical protein B0H14DRAFT_3070845 [Mycena olivaceomarginata]